MGRDEARRIFEVLHADRDAGERTGILTPRDALVHRGGLGERALRVDRNEHVDLWVQVLDAGQGMLGELSRPDLLRADLCGQTGQRLGAKVHRGRR